MPLLALAQLVQTAPVDDGGDPGLMLFVLAVLGFLACLALGAAAVAGGLAGAALASGVCVVLMAIVAMVVVTAVAHGLLAVIVLTRRPRTRVWMSPRRWAVCTVVLGLLAAVPFWWLHYVRRGGPACFRCGYDLSGRDPRTAPAGTCLVCPECGEPRR